MVRANSKVIVLGGKRFNSIAEACRELNLPNARVRLRLKKGWTEEQAFELESPPLGITVAGKTFRSIAHAAASFGIDSDTARSRVRAGWTPEQAMGLISAPLNVRFHKITVDGKDFPTLSAAAQFYKIDKAKLSARLRLGWSPEEAVDLIDRVDVSNSQKKRSIASVARENDIKPETIYRRLKTGMSLDEAIAKGQPINANSWLVNVSSLQFPVWPNIIQRMKNIFAH